MEGIWSENQLNGHGQMKTKDGDFYHGEWKNN
jgi:hypothetical protein